MRVRVYRNLHKGGYSVVSMEPGYWYMKVIDHVRSIFLRDCKFVIRKSGAKKAQETGVRNVHAFVEGMRTHAHMSFAANGKLVEITYEPFDSNKFVEKATRKPVEVSEFVLLSDTGAYAVV